MRYRNNKTTQHTSKSKFIIIGLVLVALLIVAGAYGAKTWYENQLKPVSSESRVEVVEIKAGATVQQIADSLVDKDLIRNPQAFMWYVRNNGLVESMKAGTYKIDASLTTPEVIAIITDGKIVEDTVTILPGKRLDQIKADLVKAGFTSEEIDLALEASQYNGHPALVAKPTDQTLEGYLFPETFNMSANTNAVDIIKKSLDEMAERLTPELIDKFQEQGLGIHDAVTLASIVIKESSNPDDQKKIAGVFYNRLALGMQLGSDVTYQYIADITGQERTALIDSPYNTRKYTGLPPGPIANVSKSALEAVAYPTDTDYLYFVAGDDGNIYYGKTLQEHESNVSKYCTELCSKY